MRRREFIGSMIGSAVTWPLVAQAQESKGVPLVGVLWHAGNAEQEAPFLGAFEQGLKDLGYVDGRTIKLERRFPNEIPERFVAFAAELVALKVDVLVAITDAAGVAAQHATTTIPIVFYASDPIGSKLVNSLARPGGNITGVTTTTDELSGKRLSVFKDAFPRMTRVALLVDANDPDANNQQTIDAHQTAASALGLSIHPVEVRSREEFERAFDRIADEHLEGIMAGPYSLLGQGRALLARLAMMHRLPFMGFNRRFAQAGALMSYGPDAPAIFRRAAVYVDKILKGKKPADLPVEQPMKFELLVNLKTAKELGITFPPSIMVQAEEVE
jgi:putative tryptophan/tyrosine transport system substrate-binding protein